MGILNQEAVNDTAKLIMHRLISRALDRDPSLLEYARISHVRASGRFPEKAFVNAWFDVLRRPLPELRSLLVSRTPEMNRLRLSSPFVVGGGGVHFGDPALRRRIWAAARRLRTRRAGFDIRPAASPPTET
jgi:hypothetical protein